MTFSGSHDRNDTELLDEKHEFLVGGVLGITAAVEYNDSEEQHGDVHVALKGVWCSGWSFPDSETPTKTYHDPSGKRRNNLGGVGEGWGQGAVMGQKGTRQAFAQTCR